MTPEAHGPDPEIEALIVDRYLESLLARRPVDPAGVPTEVRATAARLATDLPRFHPSFRFEEALAARLAAVAARISAGELVELPAPSAPSPSGLIGRPGRAHPAVIGGVVTSAAVSIAGAAYVAWRLRRPTDPMTRAIRAVARTRVI
jgi:hypothetical protein